MISFSGRDAVLKLLFTAMNNCYPKVNEIKIGSSQNDITQELVDVRTLAFSNRSFLEAINFDFSPLENADVLASDMARLLAEALADESSLPELRIARDKTYTALRALIDEMTRLARYALIDDKDLEKFSINYYKPSPSAKKTKPVVDTKLPATV